LAQNPQISLHELKSDMQSFAIVAADGSFHLTKVSAGIYSVRLSWAPYVKSLRLGDVLVEGPVLDLRNVSGSPSLTVTGSNASGQISGFVHIGAAPASYAHVVLLSETIPSLTNSATARADGSYSMARIAPGKYKLLVLDGSVSFPGAIRDQLADYADITESVEVHVGDRIVRDLRQHNP
jgi:hypothetical protein